MLLNKFGPVPSVRVFSRPFWLREFLPSERMRTGWRSIPAEEKKKDNKGWFDLEGEVDLSGINPDIYELRVIIKDPQANKSVQRTVVFDVE